ncbi:hypothetical protein FGB62_69g278 [Gracilaria domingensis]|nr:hypothetical protein FGB62_69g278 [Gracilaria domingensis]
MNPALNSPPHLSLSRTRSLPITPVSDTPPAASNLPSRSTSQITPPLPGGSLTDLDVTERLTHTQRVARATREYRDAWMVME